MKKKIFWIAGENSGDLHASFIIKNLNKDKKYYHFGIGGPKMVDEGFNPLFPFHRFNVMGFSEIFKDLLFFYKTEKELKKIFEKEKPDLLVLVDYPGFNLRIAKMAYNFSFPILYYISPQFWAWKHSRVVKLYDNTDHVACILPFEKELLEINKVTCTYVGHPITEEINYEMTKEQFAITHKLDLNKKWIGFFPGSRDIEIKKMLPEYLKSIKILSEENDQFEFLLSKSYTISNNIFFDMLDKENLTDITVIDNYNYCMMKYCDFLTATSGTVTLEIAYTGTPFQIAYKANNLSYQIAKKLVKLKYIGLPNIVLNKKVVPELIQSEVNAHTISENTKKILSDRDIYSKMKDELSELASVLSEKKPSLEVSKLINNLIFKDHEQNKNKT